MPRTSVVVIGLCGLFFLGALYSAEPNDKTVLAAFFVPERTAPDKTHPGRLPKTLTNGIGMELVLIPPGEFWMGSEEGDEDERPVRKESIQQAFYIGRYEVTQGQWKRLMGTQPWLTGDHVKNGDDYPAVYVSWNDVQEFIARLNGWEKCSCYRLPSEVEWEYAARAGTGSSYSFGADSARLSQYGWYADNAVKTPHAHPVGQKKPNPWGLYDMHGNVWEWVEDWHQEDIGPRMRGGSWGSPAGSLRSANRSAAQAGRRASHIGFRVVRVIEEARERSD